MSKDAQDPMAPFREVAEQLQERAQQLLAESRAIDERVDADLEGFRRRSDARRAQVHAAVRAIVERWTGRSEEEGNE